MAADPHSDLVCLLHELFRFSETMEVDVKPRGGSDERRLGGENGGHSYKCRRMKQAERALFK